jgi:hypothetical protein
MPIRNRRKLRLFGATLLETHRTAVKKGAAARQKAKVRNPAGYFTQPPRPLLLINARDGL